MMGDLIICCAKFHQRVFGVGLMSKNVAVFQSSFC
jgi:hypothetical protein